MKLLFFTEARLIQTVDQRFYSNDSSFSSQMFKRYLKVFDSVMVVARSNTDGIGAIDENRRVDNDCVTVLPLPYYIGPYQYLIKRSKLTRAIKNYIDSHTGAAIICRVPGIIGTTAANYLIKKNRPYGVEVVGNPRDVFAPGSFNHPLRAVFRYNGIENLKAVVKSASAAIYVTNASLQACYPTSSRCFSTYASDVMLPPEAFAGQAKVLKKEYPYSIVAIGSLAAMYKSPDIVIKTMAILRKRLHVSLQWLGDGRYRPKMVAMAEKAGVSDIVAFVGNVGSANEVRSYLDTSDLFVLPSRTEGLPRALLEAMARGLPCIGTDVGGIPELLDKEALVPVNDPYLLADKIMGFLTIPGLADALARRNLIESRKYSSAILDSKRAEFYTYLKDVIKVASIAVS